MDPLEEGWPSMDLAGEALHEQLHGPLAESVWVTPVRPRMVPLARKLPVLREVGGEVVTYVPVGDIGAWTERTHRLLKSPKPDMERSQRIARGRGYSWKAHARIILDTYCRLTNH